MRIDVLTLFPEIFAGPLRASLLGKAQERGLMSVHVWNLRDFTTDRHHTADDQPYGGGPGMVLKPEPIFNAMDRLRGLNRLNRIVLLTPQGRPFTQALAHELADQRDLVLLCGRYEGVDQRVTDELVTDEISIGDYVLGGGELPALVIIEAVTRLVPGVVGNAESVATDSFADGLLGVPQYTRPVTYRGRTVPDVLRSGDHAAVARWRRQQALWKTRRVRPDLLARADLSDADRALLAEEPPSTDEPLRPAEEV